MSNGKSVLSAQERAEIEAWEEVVPTTEAASDTTILRVPAAGGSNFSRIVLPHGGQLEINLASDKGILPKVNVIQPGGKVEDVPLGPSTFTVGPAASISFWSSGKENPYTLAWSFR